MSQSNNSGKVSAETHINITGTHINYYYICERKLWLFAHGLQMEQTSDTVYTGKVIDENSYAREEKHIDIDSTINIDWIDTKTGIIHEVKKSDSVEKAHEMQVLYYLWYLKQKGVKMRQGGSKNIEEEDNDLPFTSSNSSTIQLFGEIDYPLLKQKKVVFLTNEKEQELNTVLQAIHEIVGCPDTPERRNKKFCKTCSYCDLCWV